MDDNRTTNRTTDGFLSVTALKAGGLDQQAWTVGTTVHTTTLSMIRPHPNPLFRVVHLQVTPPAAVSIETVELFVDVRLARNLFRKLRNSPPSPAPGQTGSP